MSITNQTLEVLLARAAALATSPEADVEEAAAVALALAARRTAIDEALEPLKALIRKEAQEERDGPDDVVEFDGVDGDTGAGVVSVTFQAPRPAMSKTAREVTLRRLLGPEFDLYFEVTNTVAPRRDFSEVCDRRKKEHPVEVAAAMRAIDLVEPTPRVGFRPLAAVTPRASTAG
jgi:hypothetical protein